MHRIIGDKNLFAVEIDVLKYSPKLWGRSCLWIKNSQLGDFNDENILASFISSIMRIAIRYKTLWLDELSDLSIADLFYTINPFFTEPKKFYDLTYVDQEKYVKYDRFRFEFGENFDDYMINPVVKENICTFLWVTNLSTVDSSFKSDSIQSFDVKLETIQNVYKDLCEQIPDQYWPTMIEKIK